MEYTDKQLENMAEAIDNFFTTTILENNLSINAFNGVFMARMIRMNQAYDNLENLEKLLDILKENRRPQDDMMLQ